jgi:hypothetical protein
MQKRFAAEESRVHACDLLKSEIYKVIGLLISFSPQYTNNMDHEIIRKYSSLLERTSWAIIFLGMMTQGTSHRSENSHIACMYDQTRVSCCVLRCTVILTGLFA